MKKKQNRGAKIIDRPSLDSTIFSFQYNDKNGPSENIENLFIPLKTAKMELFTKETLSEKNPLKKYKICEVSINGSVMYIFNNLEQIRASLFKEIDDYVISDESLETKMYELTKCKYIIQEYLYTIAWADPIFVNPNHQFVLHFIKDTERALTVFGYLVQYLPSALAEIEHHYKLRSEILGLLYNFFELKIEHLKMLDLSSINKQTIEDEITEKNLLEVWLGLSEKGFLEHLSDVEVSKARGLFFRIFNYTDRDYKNRRDIYKRKKIKGEYLRELAKVVEDIDKKSTTPKETTNLQETTTPKETTNLQETTTPKETTTLTTTLG